MNVMAIEATTTLGGSIVDTVVNAVKGFATGISGTIVDVFNNVVVGPEGGISNLAIWGLVMGAIGLGAYFVKKFTAKAG